MRVLEQGEDGVGGVVVLVEEKGIALAIEALADPIGDGQEDLFVAAEDGRNGADGARGLPIETAAGIVAAFAHGAVAAGGFFRFGFGVNAGAAGFVNASLDVAEAPAARRTRLDELNAGIKIALRVNG